MPLRQLWSTVSTALVLAAACAAWAWRDCMLLALSMVMAYRLFLLHMDRGAPWRAMTAAVNALSAGALAVGAGIALAAAIAAAWFGWWHPTARHPTALLMALAVAAAWCCLSSSTRQEALEELRLWLCVLGGAVVAIKMRHSGWALAPCVFVAAVGLGMAWAGWRLATVTTSALLGAGSNSR